MDRIELQKLRELPIEGVAERLGLQVTRHKALCPFHDDHHASLSFSVSRNTFRCFVCNAKGGTIDLVMRRLNKDFKEACQWLADEHNVILDEWKPAPIEEMQKPFDATRYERFFERPWLSEPARRFLFDERKLDPQVVRWCRLRSWKNNQGVDWLQIPYYDREGKLTGIQNRNLNYHKEVPDSDLPSPRGEGLGVRSPRFRFAAGSQCGIYNLPVLNRLQPSEALYITEGPSDCWAMLSSGHKAIAIPSATLLSEKDKQQLSTLNCQLSTEFHMFPDRDAPGEQLFLQLKEVLPNLVHHDLPPDCKDYSEYYLSILNRQQPHTSYLLPPTSKLTSP